MTKKLYRRFAAAIGMITLCLLLAPMVKAEAKEKEEVYTWGDYSYTIHINDQDDRYVVLKSYNGQEENIILPSIIDSMHVCSTPLEYKYPDKIKSITLSKYLDQYSAMGLNMRDDLKNLESIYVTKGHPRLKSIDGVICNKKGTELYCYPKERKDKEYKIPDTVIDLEYGVFCNNQYLQKIIMGKNLKTVHSFEYSNIQTVVLSDGVEGISDQAFIGCKKLKTVVMGKNVRWIGEEAFRDCVSLRSITFSPNLVKIHSWAFENCKSLNKTLTIPGTVYSIECYAFEGCPAKLKMPSYLTWQKSHQRYRAYVKVRNTKTGRTKSYSIASMEKLRPVYKTITLKKGQSKKLQVYAYKWHEKLGIVDTGILKYTSSNSKIARVTKHGNIKAYKKGKVTVKVDFRPQMKGYDNREKYCYVTIKVK